MTLPPVIALQGELYRRQIQDQINYLHAKTGGDTGLGTAATTDATDYAAAEDATPVGSVHYVASEAIPTGWLHCNGSLVSRTTYADLFSEIAETYGAGDGSTTFALPDLRGEFIRGHDDGRGVDSGRAIGTAQSDQIEDHVHSFLAALSSSGNNGKSLPTGSSFSSGDFGYGDLTAPIRPESPVRSVDSPASVGAETRPRNIALTPIIKT